MRTLFLALAFFAPLTSCASTILELRSAEDPNFQVRYQEYAPKGEAKGFRAVIFPPTGGSTTLERSYAKKLAAKGVPTVVIEDWSGFGEIGTDAELHDRHIGRAKKAFTILAEKLPGPYRLLGTSLGGMYVAAIAAENEAVESFATVASGAPFSFVLSRSDQDGPKGVRDQRKPLWKFNSDTEYEAMLGSAISQDILPPRLPTIAAPGAQGMASAGAKWTQKKILVVVCTEDTAVPTDSQVLFWNALPNAKRIDVAASHVWGIIRAYWSHGNEIVDFLSTP
jgi:hypothetical protein